MLGWLVNYAYVHTYIYTWTDGTTSLRSFMTPVVLSCEATRVRVLFPPLFFYFLAQKAKGRKRITNKKTGEDRKRSGQKPSLRIGSKDHMLIKRDGKKKRGLGPKMSQKGKIKVSEFMPYHRFLFIFLKVMLISIFQDWVSFCLLRESIQV